MQGDRLSAFSQLTSQRMLNLGWWAKVRGDAVVATADASGLTNIQ
jgi:hypothetical protein